MSLSMCWVQPLPTDEFINYFDGSSSHVTYRAVLTRTETVSAVDIEQWEGHSKHHTDRKYILIEIPEFV